MIRFPCRCNTYLEVADDQAGGVVQCTNCGRLNDIPNLSDLQGITDDGTYKLDPANDRKERDRLAKLQRSFAKQRTDDAGDEIDLRLTMDDIADVGADHTPLELADEVRPAAPKYDPDTGELVRPLDIKKDPNRDIDPASIPMAKAVVQYASNETAGKSGVGRMLMDLFNLPSTIVIFSVFVAHVFIHFLAHTSVMMAFNTILGFFFVAPIYLAVLFLIVAHYANVIDETGPSQHDDLPRLFRNMDWHDDLWGSLCRVLTAVMVCYGPAIASIWLPINPQAHRLAALTLVIFGSGIFPAVLLTTATSGSIINLRPDKLWNVVIAIGPRYFIAALFWMIGGALYAAGFLATNPLLVSQFVSTRAWPKLLTNYVIGYPMLLGGIYFAHAICWFLGLMSREQHDQFGWMYQRHIKTDAPKRNFAVLPKAPPRKSSPAGPAPKPVQPLGTPIDAAAKHRARMQSLPKPPPPPPPWELPDHSGLE